MFEEVHNHLTAPVEHFQNAMWAGSEKNHLFYPSQYFL